MNAGVNVLLDQTLIQQNSVLEVVSMPWHECDDDVTAEGQLTVVGAGSVSNHGSLGNALPNMNDRLLVHAGSVVGTHEFTQVVDVDPLLRVCFETFLVFWNLAVFGHNDLTGSDRGHLTGTFTHNHGMGILGDLPLHSCSHNGRF